MSSKFLTRRRGRLTTALVATVASLALGVGSHSLAANDAAPGNQTARSSWSSIPVDTESTDAGTVTTLRSSWS
jgi:hypothetical protein